jgi:predicted RNA-binding Zn ribbon-like protein
MVMVSACPGTAGGGEVFSFRSRRLALDFAATLMFRGTAGGGHELLVQPGDLAAWIEAARLLDGRSRPNDADLHTARSVREAIYRIALATLAGHDPHAADRALLNRTAAAPPPTPQLDASGHLRRRGSTESAVSAIARDAVELFGSGDLGRLRQCARTGCTRLFVDRSRGGNRVWCGMRECGNRVKASAYRRRRRAPRLERA